MTRRVGQLAILLPLIAIAVGAPIGTQVSAADNPAQVGSWATPFEQDPQFHVYKDLEPDMFGPQTEHCIKNTDGSTKTYKACKSGGASEIVLPGGNLLYWDALAGTENFTHATAADFGADAVNDQVHVLDFNGPTFTPTNPSDGGANAQSQFADTQFDSCLVSGTCTYPGKGYGDLFCADQVLLANGSVLAVGGTAYYNDPGTPATDLGVVELQGLNNGRIYHPANNTWTQTVHRMNYGRWYPGVVTLPNSQVFVASGVTKLLKPAYPGGPPAYNNSNVKATETFDPGQETFTYNGLNGERSLPLFPRLHLLPDGKVYFDAAGQAFNPAGQSSDEATWNMAAVYDPATKSWTDLGIAGLGTTSAGFRGSTFSQALPLKPDKAGKYNSMSFLGAGGVLGVTPGSFVGTATSQIHTINTTTGDTLTSTPTGNLNNARWYPSGVSLPDGTVLALSGATTDEVVDPGGGMAVHTPELFTPTYDSNGVPTGGTWSALANGSRDRTYHNAAVLLPDGRVLVGGHAPIPNGYGTVQTGPGGLSNNERDPSFEIFSPPYLFYGPRPQIGHVSMPGGYGGHIAINVDDPSTIERVVLVHNSSVTHLVDGDQRTVELPFKRAADNILIADVPSNAAAAPPGPYLLFVLGKTDKGLTPSVAAQVFVGSGHDQEIGGSGGFGRGGASLPTTSTTSMARGPAPALLVAVLIPGVAVAPVWRRRRRRHRLPD